jgi:hypothetical protein
MIQGAGSGDQDYVSKARGWFKDNIQGEEEKKDFGHVVAAGAGIGAGVGAVAGMAKAAYDASNAQFDKVETKVPIMSDKLEGYDQHADPFNGKWSLKFTPTVRQEKVGEYTQVTYKAPSTWGTFASGAVGSVIGAIGGGLIAAAIKVIRDIVLNKE